MLALLLAAFAITSPFDCLLSPALSDASLAFFREASSLLRQRAAVSRHRHHLPAELCSVSLLREIFRFAARIRASCSRSRRCARFLRLRFFQYFSYFLRLLLFPPPSTFSMLPRGYRLLSRCFYAAVLHFGQADDGFRFFGLPLRLSRATAADFTLFLPARWPCRDTPPEAGCCRASASCCCRTQ